MTNSSTNLKAYLEALLDDEDLKSQVCDHRLLNSSPPQFGVSHIPWQNAINNLLKENNIKLYSHQALATDYIRSGHTIVASTPTASGKSLIYNLPVLEKYLLDPVSHALYLFPLKALAQDQLGAFKNLCATWPEAARPSIAIYDGDTPAMDRKEIRQNPPFALITNPDMLHKAILPYHQSWTSFLANLAYVIVDEAHIYRGLFGSHMAQIFRRLNRITANYGSKPEYIFCTATLGNPGELTGALIGLDRLSNPPVVISQSGAPQGNRHYIFINPLNSAATCAIDLLKRALQQNLRVIVYCRSRKMTELITMWASQDSPYKNKIASYRSGYLPNERREIEHKMANGSLKAVVSTNALELGIDIGGLDVCILVGYPGTIIQTMQRSGRVGRALQDSAVLIVAGEDALDQYFVHNPDDFYSRPPEKAIINPNNEFILEKHLECAAAEIPLKLNEDWLNNPQIHKVLINLQKKGIIVPNSSRTELLAVEKRPQRNFELRGWGLNYTIEDQSGKILGTIDGFKVWREAHPGAIYLHQGKTYEITELDTGKLRVYAKLCNVNWYTSARGHKSTEILEEEERNYFGNCAYFHGKLRVTETITGYEKRMNDGQKLINIIPLDAPPHIFETHGFWIVIPDAIRKKMERQFIHFMGSIHAIEHAAIGMLPLQIMADRDDFGGISIPMHPQLGLPAILIYDSMPGGAGLSKAAYNDIKEILKSTLKSIASCTCEDGCPSCIQSPKCGAGNRPLNKNGAIFLLRELLMENAQDGEVNLGFEICKSLQTSPLNPEEKTALPILEDLLPESKNNIEAAKYTDIQINHYFKNLIKFEKSSQELIEKKSPDKELPNNTQDFLLTEYHDLPIPDNYIVFDVETRLSAQEVGGWQNANRMGVSIVCLYDSREDKFHAYQQEELSNFFEKLYAAKLVIGFNSIRFDYQVLKPLEEIYGKACTIIKLPTLDLLQSIVKKTNLRISLNNLANATLGAKKSADGLLALRWWKEKKLDKIVEYCQKDVELTRDLYLYGKKNGFVFYTNKAGIKSKINVKF